MILLLDNYDSFTYNLYHYLRDIKADVEVLRNDEISVVEVEERFNLKKIRGVIISPGPCAPDNAGICLELVEKCASFIPMLGVCLGHQAIAQAFGGRVIRGKEPVHGKVADIYHNGKSVFKEIPSPFKATRYHSLIVEKETLPNCFEITATVKEDNEEVIMGISHREYNLHGVQFHPESIASEQGHEILKNFLKTINN